MAEDIKDKEILESKDENPPKKEKKNHHKEQIDKLELEVKTANDKYLRALAESENYKKRLQAEQAEFRKYATSRFAEEILVPYEQFAKIVDFPVTDEAIKNWLYGFKMIKDQFDAVLEKEGVKEIKALNEKFDANLHHAVDKVHVEDQPNGVIVEVLQKGYYFKDRILRPAMVKVNEWSEHKDGENK